MGKMKKPDFSGYVTKSGIKCSDGRVIANDAFKHQDGTTVPLVWQHKHDDPELVLGHVELTHKSDGVWGDAFFNGATKAVAAKEAVEHKDISAMSIFATQLREMANNVQHGNIKEVSLVLAGANPGALIKHLKLDLDGEIVQIDDEAVIFHDISSPEDGIMWGDNMEHSSFAHAAGDDAEDGPTAQEVYDSLSPEQAKLFHTMLGEAAELGTDETPPDDGTKKDPPPEGDDPDNTAEHGDKDTKEIKHMTRNLFAERDSAASAKVPDAELAHDGLSERKRLDHRDIHSILKHAADSGSIVGALESYALKHGIDNIEVLFPDARALTSQPDFDKRRTEWVTRVLNGTKKIPYSRWKTLLADITLEDARARGYVTGDLKEPEWFHLTTRKTGPQTVYKFQEFDRDDILDITDFDILAWVKLEMRLMLDEEIARAILIGDGRQVGDKFKINDPIGASSGDGIRSILHDDDLYSVKVDVNVDDPNSSPSEIVDAILEKMRFYKGSGSPVFYTTLPMLTKLLLAKDGMGRRLYRTKSELAQEIMVADIVDVEVMESVENFVGIIVNLTDYTVGADKGGDVTFFEDFKLDFNKQQYLLETRLSGGLNKIRSALVIRKVDADSVLAEPVAPTFNRTTGVITIPNITGVQYVREDTGANVAAGAMAAIAEGAHLSIRAVAKDDFYLESSGGNRWTFRRPVSA